MTFLKRSLLPFTVFITGACVLILEIVATRMLAPYFGNTIYCVSSVISVVLAALSVGYWLGGRMADRYPSKKLFFIIITMAGVLVLIMQFMQESLLPDFGYRLPLTIGPLIMAMLLFFLPSFVLGTLSPFAVALEQRGAKGRGVGTTAGQIFFFSTLGSIAGSLLAGFVLIPMFGISAIVVGVGVVLFVLGIIPVILFKIEKRFTIVTLLLAGATLVSVVSGAQGSGRGVLYSHDGVYEKITIADGTYKGRPTRFLAQDTSNSAAMYLDGDDLAYDYSKYFALQTMFAPKLRRALVLGGGAYSIPKALLTFSPDMKVDVAEIEPSLPSLAKKYFRLKDSPRLTQHIEDGRRLLHDTSARYDLIFSDVYHSLYSIPAHFTTKEFMQLVRSHLSPNGVFIANLIGSTNPHGPSFVWSQVKTMQAVFPQVYMFAVNSPSQARAQNIIAVGAASPVRLDVDDPRWSKSPYQAVREAADHYVPTEKISFVHYPILTDDYAPVDYLAAQVLPKH